MYYSTAGLRIGDNPVDTGSTIPITNVGSGATGNQGIACLTDSPSTAEWFFPDGSTVPLGSSGRADPNTISSFRQTNAITLNRGDGVLTPAGPYCCGSEAKVNERLCITIGKYKSVHGSELVKL